MWEPGVSGGNEICRLFILPEYQAKGYGNRLMDFLEDMVFGKYQAVHIDASFPAESMYLKRGYRNVWSRQETTEYMVWNRSGI